MALTKVAGDILDPGLSIAGVVTATAFDGPFRGGSGSDIIAGVGTFTELDVNGNADFSGNVTIGGSFTVQGDYTTLNTTLRNVELLRVAANSSTTAGIITQTGSGDILNLFDGTTEVMTVVDGGNVGIGLTNPTKLLELKGTDPTIKLWDSSGDAYALIEGDSADQGSLRFRADPLGGGGSTHIRFDVDGSEALRINSSGNVGINTTTPQTEMEVFSDGFANITIHSARTSGHIGGFDFSNGASAAGIQTAQYFVHTSGHHYWHCNGSERLKLENDGDLTITGVDNAELKLKCGATNGNNILAFLNSAGATKGRIFYDSDNNFMVFNTDGTSDERMRITNAGAVGIGTNNPQYELHVWPPASTSSGQICAQSNGNNTFAELVLKTTTGGSANIWKNSTGKTDYGGADSLNFYQGANANIAFFTNGNNERLRIKSGGNLKLPDSAKIELGGAQNATGDLQIYHDTTDSKIVTSTGDMWLQSTADDVVVRAADNISLQVQGGEYGIDIAGNAAVQLYYDASVHTTAKLATTATGVSVHGEVAASQDYPNYQPALDFNFAAVKKLDSRFTFTRTGPASYVDENGYVKIVAANVPRFDHDPVTKECKGLLVEQNIPNWIYYGTHLENTGTGGWDLNGTTHVLAPDVVAPDGTTGGVWEQFETTSNAYHASYFTGNIPVTSGQTYTVSCWLKKGPNYRTDINSGRYQLYCTRGGANPVASIQLNSDFTYHTKNVCTDHSVTKYPNGWVRVTYSFTSNGTTGNVQPHFLLGNGGSYSGNGTNSVYIWGCQFESLPFPTSYIHTNGSVVYRGEDIVKLDGTEFTDVFNPDEGTSVVHAHMPNSNGASGLPAYAFKNSAVSAVHLGLSKDNNASPAYHYYHDGSNNGYTRASGNNQNMYKGALSFKTNDLDSYVNGSANTNTTTFTMPTIDNLRIGGTSGANYISGHVARFMYYPVKLTNNQLITLTS